MKKNNKKNRIVIFSIIIVMIVAAIVTVFVGFYLLDKNRIRSLKYEIESWIYGGTEPSYNAKSLVMVDLKYDDDFVSKNVREKQLPASLAKLFVIEYARTLANLDDIVEPNIEAISMIKEGSSVANIATKKYYLKDLFAAMLVPSGNDAAYAVADYCGGKLASNVNSSKERINIFMEALNRYMKEQGYKDTVINDPSGYDIEAYTTVLDLKAVCKNLIKLSWFKEIVSQTTYTATLLDGTSQTWKNTNKFLDPKFDYYNKDILGIKTGSLADDYNLVVLYNQYGRDFLICSLGSQSNSSRYDDVNYILQTINNSNYLRGK